MAERITKEQIIEVADIVEAPRPAHQVDRTFELPTGLYGATVSIFLAYIALMATGFSHPEMILPTAIFVLFVIAGFGVPAIWTRLDPATRSKSITWGRFKQDGIMTGSGHSTASAAMVQVLILPVLIFAWGVAVVTIAALV